MKFRHKIFFVLTIIFLVSNCHKDQWQIYHHCDIEGHVVDSYTGQKYPNTKVVLRYQYIKSDHSIGNKYKETETDNEGKFTFNDHPFKLSASQITLSEGDSNLATINSNELTFNLNRKNKKINLAIYVSCGGTVNLKINTKTNVFYYADFTVMTLDNIVGLSGPYFYPYSGSNGIYNIKVPFYGSGNVGSTITCYLKDQISNVVTSKSINLPVYPCYQTINDSIIFP